VEGLTRSAFARPVLALVPNPVRARRAPFVALILGVLLVGLLSLLLLNTTTAQDAFKLHRLQVSAANTADERQVLSEQVNQLTGPGGLAAQAVGMGMVPVGPPVFWKPGDPLPPGARILDGMIVVPAGASAPGAPAPPAPAAAPKPAPGDVAVTAVPRPGQSAAPKPSTSAKASAKATPKPSTSASARPSAKAPAKPSAQASTKPSRTTKPSARAATGTSTTGSRR
jgi:outer membrane biosynthesis protein TonB